MKKLLVICIGVALFHGCSRDGDKGENVASSTQVTNQIASACDQLLVTVNGENLTQADVDDEVDVRISLIKMRKQRLSETALSRVKASIVKTAIPHFVQEKVYSTYARSLDIAVREPDFNARCQKIAKTYDQNSFEAVRAKLGKEKSELLERGIRSELLVEAAKQRIVKEAQVKITEERVQSELKRLTRLNQTAVKTNELVYATASNVWKQITANTLTFEEAVQDYGEQGSGAADGAWMTVKVSQLHGEPSLAATLLGMKEGDVTSPIEADNGLCLVKVVRRYREHSDDVEDTFDLAQVFFRLAETWGEVSADEMRDGLLEQAKKMALDKKFDELLKKSRVVQHLKPERAKNPYNR